MASLKIATSAMLLITLTMSVGVTKTAKFNITEILNEFPEFTTFNSLLSKMNLTEEINQRQTITVFVTDNSASAAITSLPTETQKKVLEVQVILDYYDPVKLEDITNNTAQLTTLFQASGAATDRMGFVIYTLADDDEMAFGSAEPGASINSQLVKVVACRPYNVSVMQISTPIIPPSIRLPGKKNGAPATGLVNSYDPLSTAKEEESPKTISLLTTDAEEPSPTADDPAAADAAAAPQAVKSASTAADTHTLVGYSMLVRSTSVIGLMGPVIFMM